jgi:uncharacterized protein YceK
MCIKEPSLKQLFLILISAITLSGCSSIYTLSSDFDKALSSSDVCPQDCTVHRIYSGVSLDVCILRSDNAGQGGAIAFWDLPFSFVVDTVALPYTIYKQASVGGSVSHPLGPVSQCENTHNKSSKKDAQTARASS